MKSVRKFTEQTCINTFCQHGHSVTGGQPQHSGIKRTTAGNMTQFPAGEEQEKGGDVTEIQSYITFVKSTGRNSLADLARDLERALLVVLFLKHLGGNGGSSRDPTHTKKNLSLSLVLLLRLRLPHPVAPTLSLFSLWSLSDTLTPTHTLTHTLTSEQWQPLPDRLTGVSPPRLPQRRTGPTCSRALSFSCPSFSSGALTHSQLSQQGPLMTTMHNSWRCRDTEFLQGLERTKHILFIQTAFTGGQNTG